MSYQIIKGDLEPDMLLTATVNDAPEVLTGALALQLRWKKPGGTVVTVDLTAVDLAAGQVKRVWLAGDTDEVGAHRGQIVVTRPNGEMQTFPSDGSYVIWIVHPQLS